MDRDLVSFLPPPSAAKVAAAADLDQLSVFVKGLPYLYATPELLKTEFRKFGPLSADYEIEIQRDYAFVEFKEASSAERAIDASPIMINGHPVLILHSYQTAFRKPKSQKKGMVKTEIARALASEKSKMIRRHAEGDIVGAVTSVSSSNVVRHRRHVDGDIVGAVASVSSSKAVRNRIHVDGDIMGVIASVPRSEVVRDKRQTEGDNVVVDTSQGMSKSEEVSIRERDAENILYVWPHSKNTGGNIAEKSKTSTINNKKFGQFLTKIIGCLISRS